MNSIKEGKVLLLNDLPSGLISRRQLTKHFSPFGTIERISLDKNIGNCLISFSSYSDAVNAKSKGHTWNNVPLNIYWAKNSSLDPRSKDRNKHSYDTNEEVVDVLWSDDDKECFGIEEDKTSRAFKSKRQKTFNDLITSHLKTTKNPGGVGVKLPLEQSPSIFNSGSEIKQKEEKRTPVIFRSDSTKEKHVSIKDMKRNFTKPITSDDSSPQFGESILKRKMEHSKDNTKNVSSLKTYRIARKVGESVLTKKSNLDPDKFVLKEHGCEFIERKIVEAMETDSIIQDRIDSEPKELVKINKRTVTQTNLTKKKPVNLGKELPSEIISDNNAKLQLKNNVVVTLKKKYNLLDERDKTLRKLQVKDSNVMTAGAMKGTCPDMCPEKERIMRSFQRLMSIYEMGVDTNEMIDHLAVKEYSRSSADQDEPLPHELRPEPVLTMTMNYLISNIINRVENPEENISEWYNFCWDRLRGIRKDIIQQQLCSLQVVEIIEQCARFHICCYDYLWGVDVSIFDDKINTENLMNCLQTLMHMYEDLAKQDVFCPNEAEFNAYMIVLKLNSGDILWEYQNFVSEVQVSPFSKAAINLYNTFNNKMFNRFFSIVKKSPYLLACLSHRFFSHVRTSALETIAEAFTPRRKVVFFPLDYMMTALKCDTVEDTVTFCESHGIPFNIIKQEFGLKKNRFYKPESLVQVKSFSSIIRNMRSSPAQAVVGETNEIPKYTPHEVHSSFDDEGNLKPESLDAADQELKVEKRFPKLLQPSPVKTFESAPLGTLSTISPLKDFTKPFTEAEKPAFKFVLPQIISPSANDANSSNPDKPSESPSHITGEVFKTPDNSFVEQDVLQIPVEDLPHDLYDPFYDAQDNQVGDIQAVEIDAARVEEIYQDVKKYYEHVNEPIMKNNEPFKNQFNNIPGKENKDPLPVLESTINYKVNDKENIINNLEQNISSQSEENKKKNFDNVSLPPKISNPPETKTNFKFKLEQKTIVEKIVDESKKQEDLLKLQKEKEKIAKMKREMEAKRKKEIEEQKLLQKLKKDLRERLKVASARFYAKRWKERVERLKKNREDFPTLVHLSVKDHLTMWGSVVISEQPTTSVGIIQRLKQRNTITNVVNGVLQSGIPNSVSYCGELIAEKIASTLLSKLQSRRNIRPIFWKLIVSIPKSVNEDTSNLTKLIEIWCKKTFYKNEAELGTVQSIVTSFQIPVYICVHLLKNENDFGLCNGMSSLMFLTVNQWETTKQTLHRFRTLVKSQNSHVNSCFVSVLKIGGAVLDSKLKEDLITCKHDGVISDWMFQEWSNPNCISLSLNLMAQQVEFAPEICVAPIDFLLREVSEQFFSVLSADQYSSIGLRNACHMPNNVIRLYNICIAKLEDLLISSKLEKYSYFPDEFNSYVSRLDVPGGIEQFSGSKYDREYRKKISKILHSLTLPEFTNWPPKTCDCLSKMLKSYCKSVHDDALFPQIIRLIDICDGDDIAEYLGSISWINITELWAKQIISYQIQLLNKKSSKKTSVLYNKQLVDKLVTGRWWLKTGIVINSNFGEK